MLLNSDLMSLVSQVVSLLLLNSSSFDEDIFIVGADNILLVILQTFNHADFSIQKHLLSENSVCIHVTLPDMSVGCSRVDIFKKSKLWKKHESTFSFKQN